MYIHDETMGDMTTNPEHIERAIHDALDSAWSNGRVEMDDGEPSLLDLAAIATEAILPMIDSGAVAPEPPVAAVEDYHSVENATSAPLSPLSPLSPQAPAEQEGCPSCGKARDDLTPGPHAEGWGVCPESFHFRASYVRPVPPKPDA